jgi:hypothetical protein
VNGGLKAMLGRWLSDFSFSRSQSFLPYVNVWRYGFDILYTMGEYVLHQRGLRKVTKFDIT